MQNLLKFFAKFLLIALGAFFAKIAIAEDIVISSPTSTDARYSFTEDNQKFIINYGNDATGNFFIHTGSPDLAALSLNNYSNAQVEINTTSSEKFKGIFVSGLNIPAIEVSGSGTLSSITTNGVIASGVSSDRGATIYLNGTGGTTTLNNNGTYVYNYKTDGNVLQTTASSGTALVVNNTNSGFINGNILIQGGSLVLNNDNSYVSAGKVIIAENSLATINNVGGYLISPIDLGTNPNSSIVNSGYVYDVTMNNSEQLITSSAGSIIKVNGAGTVLFAHDSYITGDFGSESKVGKVVLADNANLRISENKIFNVGSLEIGNNSVLDPSSAIVSTVITPTSDGAGAIEFYTSNQNFNADIGTPEKRLGSLNISGSSSVNILNSDYNVIKTNFAPGNNSITLGAGQINSVFDSIYSFNIGAVVNFSANNNFASGVKFGDVNGLSGFNVLDGANIFVSESIKSNNITIGEGELGASLTLAAVKNISGSVVINTDSSLILEGGNSVSGTIRGAADGVGRVVFNGDYTLQNNIGDGGFSLAEIVLAENTKLDLAAFNLKTEALTMASGAAVEMGSGVLDFELKMSDGAALKLGNGAILNINENSYLAGEIDGSSDGNGTINSSGNVIINNKIGSNSRISAFNILEGSNLVLNQDLGAVDVEVFGALSLGNSPRQISGNLNLHENSAINLGSASHKVAGDLSIAAGSAIALDINGQSSSGNILVSGMAFLDSNVSLNVSVLGATLQDKVYTIISADNESVLNQILSEKITVNSLIGDYRFTTFIDGNKLMLKVVSAPTTPFDSSVGSNQNQKTVYDSIVNKTTSPNGTLASLQQFLNSSNNSSEVKTAAINSITPQVDNSPNRVVFDTTNSTLNMIGNRLDNLRSNFFSSRNTSNTDGRAEKAVTGVSSGDELMRKNVWIQQFASKIDQGNSAASVGYKANSLGVAFGGDHEINDDFVLGIGGSYAHSNAKSRDTLKLNSISTYQANIYSGYNFDKFFLNSMLGVAFNRYESTRAIPLFSLTASSRYSGRSYLARIEGGSVEDLVNNFVLSPSIMITAAYNRLNSYSESGAGALNLKVRNDSSSFFETRLGAKLSRKFSITAETVIAPEFSVSYGYDFAGSKQKMTSNFIGQQTTFDSSSARVAQGSLKFGSGINIYTNDTATISANYDYEHRKNYQAHTGNLKFKYSF